MNSFDGDNIKHVDARIAVVWNLNPFSPILLHGRLSYGVALVILLNVVKLLPLADMPGLSSNICWVVLIFLTLLV